MHKPSPEQIQAIILEANRRDRQGVALVDESQVDALKEHRANYQALIRAVWLADPAPKATRPDPS